MKKLISVIVSVCLITGVVAQPQAALVLDDAEKDALTALYSRNPVKFVARLMVLCSIPLDSIYSVLKDVLEEQLRTVKHFYSSVLVETYHNETQSIAFKNNDDFFKSFESNSTRAVAYEIFKYGISSAQLYSAMQKEDRKLEEERKQKEELKQKEEQRKAAARKECERVMMDLN
ncbi:MAG: hypothetical protein LBB06_01690 [Endomicrobium sp.]|nr:hypothetical protein [Endomicrobium sp.]